MTRKLLGTALLAATALSASGAWAQDASSITGALPAELKALYDGAPQTVTPADLSGFTAPPKPWRWCHSESYQGNPWRVAVTNELKRLVDGLIAEGTVASFEVADSNNDVSQQINQIRGFIDKGCTVITSIPGSATALDDAIASAHEKGIPFITAAGSVSSPYAINVDSNYVRWGYEMMTAIGKSKSDASVLLVEGIAGHPIVVQEREGADKALAENPGVKAPRTVNGNWTANVTKTVVLQAIATNPAPIDAVWTTGSEARVVAEAFTEAGRPAPLVTGSLTGDALGYWKANPDRFRFEGHAVLPGWTAQTLFRVAARTLEGQEPKLNTLMIPIPPVHEAELANWYQPCMTADAVSVFPVPPQDPMPEEWLDAYFAKPAKSPGWDYSKVPAACPN